MPNRYGRFGPIFKGSIGKEGKNRPNIWALSVVIMLGRGESEDVFGLGRRMKQVAYSDERRMAKKAMAENKQKLLTITAPLSPSFKL